MKAWLWFRPTEHERAAPLLSPYLDGRLDAGARALVEKHLPGCPACQTDLATLQATLQAARALPTQRLPRSFTLPRSMARQARPRGVLPLFRTASALAAVASLVVVVGYVIGTGALRPGPAHPPQQVAMQTSLPEVEKTVVVESPPVAGEVFVLSPTEPARIEAPLPPVEAPLGVGGAPGPGAATPEMMRAAPPSPTQDLAAGVLASEQVSLAPIQPAGGELLPSPSPGLPAVSLSNKALSLPLYLPLVLRSLP